MKKFTTLSLLILFVLATLSISTPVGASEIKEVIIKSNQANLFCRTMGKGSPIIVLHGGPGLSQEYLLPHMSKLAEDHFVIFYDQRGSGCTEGGDDFSLIQLPIFVSDLETIRQAFGLEKVSLVGHSWGCFLGLNYALSHPEVIDKLVLLNPMPASSDDFGLFLAEWSSRMAPYMAELDKLKHSQAFVEGDPETVANLLKIVFSRYCVVNHKVDELRLRVSKQANLNWIKTSDIFNRTLLAGPFNLYPHLGKLSCQTLIIHGDQDPVPLSTAKNLQSSLSNSALVILKECGHFPYVEKPDELFDQLKAFLK